MPEHELKIIYPIGQFSVSKYFVGSIRGPSGPSYRYLTRKTELLNLIFSVWLRLTEHIDIGKGTSMKKELRGEKKIHVNSQPFSPPK